VTVSLLDGAYCDDLVARSAAGDAGARRRLIEQLWPTWIEMVRANRSMGSFARSEDHVDNVVGKLIEKIGRSDGRELRRYLAWRASHAEQTFGDWIRIITKNAIRDYLREQLGRTRAAAVGEPSAKRLLNEFALSVPIEELGARPPITAAQTARELLEFAASRLPPEQIAALRDWLFGASFQEVGKAQGISPIEAQKRIRAGVAVLRRHFGPAEGRVDEPG
jgi:DNA-directed RNA polymerase specialized sigma24 family protein